MPVSRAEVDVLDRAGSWLTRSGIQESNGGVARYYRADLGQNARVSTEITGYAVSAFVYLYHEIGDADYLSAGVRAADFLVHRAWKSGLSIFPFEHALNGDSPEPLAYFFDSGIIARGLLALWQVTREEKYLTAASEAAESMLRDFMPSSAPPHPILVLPSKQPLPYEARWSRSPGCYQLKSALAWYELAQLGGSQRFADAFEQALAATLDSHHSFLPGSDDENTVDRLHAYCYFLEALLHVADRPACRTALEHGIDAVSVTLRALRPKFVRSDVYAQLLRIRLWAEKSGIGLDATAAREEAEAVPEFQVQSADSRTAGGFWFGRKAGQVLPYVNPVSTVFCLQAWRMWRQRRSGFVEVPPRALI